MSMSDPLGDMLTRIRNGQHANKDAPFIPYKPKCTRHPGSSEATQNQNRHTVFTSAWVRAAADNRLRVRKAFP